MKRTMIIFATTAVMATAPLIGMASAQTVQSAAGIQFVTEQPAGEWRARVFLGSAVQNTAGEVVGDINDLIFDRNGHISTVVIGVGGFLGIGERNVGVPFNALTYAAGKDGARMIVVALTKDTLKIAAPFKATEKTTLDAMGDKAVQLKDQAAQKINEMTKSAPVKQ